MIASMLAYFPAGMEHPIMFHYMFLSWLAVTLRSLLGEQEPGDIRSLVTRADRLWATHKPQSHDLVAHVNTAEEQLAQIAALQKKEPAQKKKFAGKKPGGQPPAVGGGQAMAASGSGSSSGSLTPYQQTRVSSGLCNYHWNHGAKASKLSATCSWTGD
jgi:hypothetical protein